MAEAPMTLADFLTRSRVLQADYARISAITGTAPRTLTQWAKDTALLLSDPATQWDPNYLPGTVSGASDVPLPFPLASLEQGAAIVAKLTQADPTLALTRVESGVQVIKPAALPGYASATAGQVISRGINGEIAWQSPTSVNLAVTTLPNGYLSVTSTAGGGNIDTAAVLNIVQQQTLSLASVPDSMVIGGVTVTGKVYQPTAPAGYTPSITTIAQAAVASIVQQQTLSLTSVPDSVVISGVTVTGKVYQPVAPANYTPSITSIAQGAVAGSVASAFTSTGLSAQVNADSGSSGTLANEAALTGVAAGTYHIGSVYVTWSGSAVTQRAPVLATQVGVDGVQAVFTDQRRAPLYAPASTRGVIFRGGIPYYPAPAGLAADGTNIIDEGSTGLYYRSTGDVMPWEYGALPGTEFSGPDAGVGLAAWTAGAPNHSRLYLPPGHWWTGRSLIMERTNLHLNFRGTLHAAPGFTGFLVDADAGHTPAPAGQLPSYYDTTLGNALWYKRIQVEAMTLNGESHSRGVRFSRWDHFHIANVTVHKAYGSAAAMDRLREGNVYGLGLFHSRAGPDNAVLDISEAGPGDTANLVNYNGVRIAAFTGRALYCDSPHMTEVESVSPAIGAPNLPARFLNFYGLFVEDIIKGQGFKFDNVTTEYPDPTSDRIWIRRGRYINIRGGLINAGDITTGSVIRIGDSTLGQPVLSCLIDTDVYAFAGTGYALKAESVVNLNVTKEFWLSDGVKNIQDPSTGRVPAENRQPTLTRMPGSQAVLRAVNETAGAGDSPTLQLGDGNGNNLLLGQVGTNSGYSQFLLKPAAAAATTFMGDTNGALWTSGAQIKLGSGTNKVAWAIFAPQTGEPYDKSVGSLAVGGSSAGWNPLARAATFFPMFYNGSAWLEVNTGLVPTAAPAALSAAPSMADFNNLLSILKASKILL